MLPAWATVVIAIGGALIGAAAGVLASVSASRSATRASDLAYRSAERDLTHETTEEWRKLQIEVCRALSDAWLEFRWLLYPASRGFDAFDDEAKGRLGPLGTTCAQTVAKARLVFGRDSEAGEAADAVDGKIAQLKDAAYAPTPPWDEAEREEVKSCIEEAEQAHAAFLLKAHVAIQPEPLWQPEDFALTSTSDLSAADEHAQRR
jgi:hypothetical protein